MVYKIAESWYQAHISYIFGIIRVFLRYAIGTEVVPSINGKKQIRDYPYLYTDSINNHALFIQTRDRNEEDIF
jgi:hypothetical protein